MSASRGEPDLLADLLRELHGTVAELERERHGVAAAAAHEVHGAPLPWQQRRRAEPQPPTRKGRP